MRVSPWFFHGAAITPTPPTVKHQGIFEILSRLRHVNVTRIWPHVMQIHCVKRNKKETRIHGAGSSPPPPPAVYIGYPPPTDFTMAQFTTHDILSITSDHRNNPDTSISNPRGCCFFVCVFGFWLTRVRQIDSRFTILLRHQQSTCCLYQF